MELKQPLCIDNAIQYMSPVSLVFQTKETIGDLNLDYNKRFDANYQRENLFELFESKLGELNLLQLVCKHATFKRQATALEKELELNVT